MDPHVALLRGINVGGGNRVLMAGLRALCADLGWRGVGSYIASGNLVFRARAGEDHAARLHRAIHAAFGLDIRIFVLPGDAFRAEVGRCPFDPKNGRDVRAFFLSAPPVFDAALYEALRTESEEIAVRGTVAWLHAPDGIGRSKLAAGLHRVISGAEMTGRNLNTLAALVVLLDEAGRNV